jgi:hypothetical protein
MEQYLEYIIPGICTAIVAIIEFRAARDRRKEEAEIERTKKQATRRAEESQLSMELMSANCKLAVVTAKALTNQKLNGDVEEAMEASRKAQEQYNAYIRREAAARTAKV